MRSSAPLPILVSILFLPILALGRSTRNKTSDPSGPELTQEDYWNFVQDCTALEYGDSCSWEDELARQDEIRQSQNFPRTSPLREKLMKEFIKSSLDKGRKYCPATNKLVCDQVTETCVCGEATIQVELGDAYKPLSYVLEKNEEGQKFCRLGQGTACDPPKNKYWKTNFAYKIGKAVFESGPDCGKGLDCLVQGKGHQGQLCNNNTYLDYVYENMIKRKDTLTYGEIKKDFYTGKVCACQESDSRNELVSGEDFGQGTGDGRNKRSPEEGMANPFERVLTVWAPQLDY